MHAMISETLVDYPFRIEESLRYCDTDRQGHVNNSVYSVFFEAGRVHLLRAPNAPAPTEGGEYVLARIAIDFRRELFWPGAVTVGTGLVRLGRSSFTLAQAVFHEGALAASAESVLVLTDPGTRRSTPLPDAVRAGLERFRLG